MKLHTIFRITTGDYHFNDIGELINQIDNFGFSFSTSIGKAHEDGRIVESEFNQLSANQFIVNLIWNDELTYYQFLVSPETSQALDFIYNLSWTIETLEKETIE